MEDLNFIEAEPADIGSFDFEPSLFHYPQHLKLQQEAGWKWYYALHPKHKRIIASIYIHIEGITASTALRSPFGTVEYSGHIVPETLFRFLLFVEDCLRRVGVRSLVIKTPPIHYAAGKASLLQTFMFNQGYRVINAEAGAVRFTNEPFVNGLNRLERRKLKRSVQAGLAFRFISAEQFDNVYSFIHKCRLQKGFHLSMSRNELEAVITQFPSRFLFSAAFCKDEMICASVAVRVSSDVLYLFYADHDKTYDHLSPVVYLAQHLFEYCTDQGISILDFGTSATDGRPNFGLLLFKMRMGAIPSSKLTFEKTIDP